MTKRLTPVQIGVLQAMNSGTDLIQHFDVYGGYWNTMADNPVRKTTVESLFYGRLIEKTEPERVFSGRQKMIWKLTAAGSSLVTSQDLARQPGEQT